VTVETTTNASGHAGVVAVTGVAVASHPSSESNSLPGWAWLLIGAGGVLIIVLAAQAIRRRRRKADAPPSPDEPGNGLDDGPPT
jgi:hypothetical protein